MSDYQAYVVGEEGRITQRIDLACDDDEMAKENASGFAGKNTIELWQNDRLIAKFPRSL